MGLIPHAASVAEDQPAHSHSLSMHYPSCGKKALRLHAEGPYHIKNIRTIKTNQEFLGASGPLDPPRALRPPGPQL
ncbi:hypothetical protein DPMN_027017 [Dreissena polymorpha]|uniref:Uncharacterized protein n=1 Tax=Dreissena polymorpha TaxID=45954 RepID=A0A9D4LTZ3_DREPO|nr:hypothetical protein DPMN_027017 [Dreissena polymorpha]